MKTIQDKLNQLKINFQHEVNDCNQLLELQIINNRYFKKNDYIKELLVQVKDSGSLDNKKQIGNLLNEYKIFIKNLVDQKIEILQQQNSQKNTFQYDYTLPPNNNLLFG
jgi:phenylalanyl-tRNA synthetase alpha subunit